MRIGIIGSGNIGGTSAALLARAGHDVVIANRRGPESLADLVGSIGPRARAGTVEEAADTDVVIVAVPLSAREDLPADALAGRIVIDAMNHYPDRDGHIDAIETGETGSSEIVAALLPDARVVKALNTIWYERLRTEGRATGDPDRLAVPIAGDDADAKEVVAALIDDMGFDAVDAGSLRDGRRQQPGAPVYNRPLTADGVRAVLAEG